MIHQSRAFVWQANQANVPHVERQTRLHESLRSKEDFVRLYERTVAYEVLEGAGEEGQVLPEQLRALLDLPEAPQDLAYCASLLEDARATRVSE